VLALWFVLRGTVNLVREAIAIVNLLKSYKNIYDFLTEKINIAVNENRHLGACLVELPKI